MAKYIIGFVGEQASGKDHGAGQLVTALGASTYKFSAPMSDCLKHLDIVNTRDNLVRFSEITREGREKDAPGLVGQDATVPIEVIDRCLERLLQPINDGHRAHFRQLIGSFVWSVPGYGDNHYSKVVAASCISDPSEFTFANGIRRMPDIENLIELPNFYLIYVTAPARVRYERIIKRKERPDEEHMTFEKFMELEKASTEVDIPRLGCQYAHFKYTNVGSPEAYRAFLDSVIATIRSAP